MERNKDFTGLAMPDKYWKAITRVRFFNLFSDVNMIRFRLPDGNNHYEWRTGSVNCIVNIGFKFDNMAESEYRGPILAEQIIGLADEQMNHDAREHLGWAITAELEKTCPYGTKDESWVGDVTISKIRAIAQLDTGYFVQMEIEKK